MSKIGEDAYDDDDDHLNEYPSSGEEWSGPKATQKKRTTRRRTSQRLSKKPRISLDLSGSDSGSSDSENETIIASRESRGFRGFRGKKKSIKLKIPKTYPRKSLPVGLCIYNNSNFITGSFVVTKKDVQIGDVSKPPCIWRIDGKALLQKFEAYEENGKTLHRSTSIYTGWSPLDKDLYAPVNVCVRWHTSQQMTVELEWETLRNVTMDSD